MSDDGYALVEDHGEIAGGWVFSRLGGPRCVRPREAADVLGAQKVRAVDARVGVPVALPWPCPRR